MSHVTGGSKSLYGDPDQLSAAPMPYTLYPPSPLHLQQPYCQPSPPLLQQEQQPSVLLSPSAPSTFPQQQQPEQQQTPPQRPSPPRQTSSFRSRRAPVKSSKNTYPCPLGVQYACDRYFTTSGHAARHAKIHSGEKNIQCPECDKKFARKDNMDQHRKTHRIRGGTGHNNALDSDMSDAEGEFEGESNNNREDALKVEAKLRRARKRNMRSPERGLRNESDESVATSGVTDCESLYREGRKRTSSSGSNSLDVLANVALGRTYDSDA